MPRPALRRARATVRDFCDERGVPYAETTLGDSYRQALAHLHAVGRPRGPSAAPPAPSGG